MGAFAFTTHSLPREFTAPTGKVPGKAIYMADHRPCPCSRIFSSLPSPHLPRWGPEVRPLPTGHSRWQSAAGNPPRFAFPPSLQLPAKQR